jgi:putative Ca2+/H+ antiporter (TMEM165/GDT1 family)
MSSPAQASICIVIGSTGDKTQIATASSSAPKNLRTDVIHAPAFGSSAPSVTPTATSGTPMPRAIANSAAPPKATSRV